MDSSPKDDEPEFRPLVEPKHELPAIDQFSPELVFKDAFRLRTLCLFGALFQILLSRIVPSPWCFVPALFLTLHAVFATIVQASSSSSSSNPFTADTVPGRATAQLPCLRSLGLGYGTQPAARPLVVFHFGVRFNHPLGVFSPGAMKAKDHLQKMLRSLDEDRRERTKSKYGLLGTNLFRGTSRTSHDTLLYVFYFRDAEGLQRFANDKLHREAYQWLRSSSRYQHIAAFHETFCVPEGAYESMYLNSAPVLLGDTYTLQVGESDGKESTRWKTSLVDASTPRLQTMARRLGREGIEE